MDLSSLDLQTLGALASIAGLLPNFVQWFTSEYRAIQSKRKEKTKDIIEHYIEWLRRQRHDELLSKLSGSQQALTELDNLVKQLVSKSEEDQERRRSRSYFGSTGEFRRRIAQEIGRHRQ